jgi:uracil-DNA glycosylase family 4
MGQSAGHIPPDRSVNVEPSRLRRAVVQQLNALQLAGVSHVPKRSSSPQSKEVQQSTHSGGKTDEPAGRWAALDAIRCRVEGCKRCHELAASRTQTVFGAGDPHARLVFLGEAPGADEDRQGEPFVGRAGQLLNDMITKGMKLRREDVYILNVLKCRPPDNRTPTPDEAANCREYLDAQLAVIAPQFLCCLGAVAAQNLLGSTASISRLRGRIHDYRGAKVVCTYHPAYLLRNPAAKRDAWEDLKLLMREMGI